MSGYRSTYAEALFPRSCVPAALLLPPFFRTFRIMKLEEHTSF